MKQSWYIILLSITLIGSPGLAQDTSLTDSVITIGIKQAPPFVELREGYAPDGLSLEFWSEVEGAAQVLYEFRQFESLEELMDALENGEIDMSINPITVTQERMQKLSFAQPFYISGTTLVRQRTNDWWTVLRNMFSWKFLSAVAVLLLVIFMFGLLIWLFEHRKNKEMFGDGAKGIGDGFWWSAVTMTTVGYGDKAPVTRGGRIVGLIWMFAAIIMISGLTASIASALTVSNIESKIAGAEDLRKYDVGTIGGSSSADYLEIFDVDFQGFQSVQQGLTAVENGDIDMFVYDRPILKYYLNSMNFTELRLINKDLKTDYYSFTYPKGSNLRDYLDPFVVKALRSERWNYRLKRENTVD